MSITDELREYVSHYSVAGSTKDKLLTAIADRIDAEHEREIAAAAFVAGVPMTDEAMAEYGWVRLPKDADGVPIHFGDKITVPWRDKVYEVAGFSYGQKLAGGERTIWVDVYSHEKPGNVPLCGADGCHHYHVPSVEDVLVELLKRYDPDELDEDTTIKDLLPEWQETIADFAKRLRLAEEES